MKSIIELNEIEAREFLLKEKNYVNFDLPTYFSFQNLLNLIDKQLTGKKLSDYRSINPRDFDDINYFILNNKDGKYAWRPFQLINPAIYVSLVHCITERENWELIKIKFRDYQINDKIECQSLPVVSESEEKTDKESQIFTWWQLIEQKSISLSLDYHYMLQTDITDCYGSIYTHSISWAIHGKPEAKKKENRTKNSLIGVAIDNHLQDMSYGQTNGIPQGSTLMDFIAEIVLGYVDELLTIKIVELGILDYKILRYRDDYRIFTNNPFEAEQITKALSEILSDMGLKLNAGKTEASDNVIKSSLKPDKRYWIANRRIAENKQKWLIQLFLLSEQFPNSGTLDTQMKDFLEVLKKSEKEDSNIESLISLVTEIAYRNPRVVPTAIMTLSLLIKKLKAKDNKKQILKRIHSKFQQIPNSTFLKIWLQRLTLKLDTSIIYDEPICQLILNNDIQLWNFDWLSDSIKQKIKKETIIVQSKVKTLRAVVTNREIENMITNNAYNYE
jgi:RNA-directed DNA polymerase